MMPSHKHPLRLLVIPGLHGSGDAHWQTWLQAHFKRSRRNLGDAGHINVDAGFGPLPVAKKLIELLIRRVELQLRQAVAA